MPLSIAETHPIFVRAREAARARPEFRVSRPPAPVTRLSNAPVRLSGSLPIVMAAPESPTELPPPNPPQPEPAPPEVTDIPPSSIPLPTHQPPGMTPPIA